LETKIRFLDDYRLVHKFLIGDDEAGRQLYADVYSVVSRYVHKLVKNGILNKQDTDDIISESLLRSVQDIRSFRGDSQFSSWVCAYARNVFRELLRKKKKELLVEDIADYEYTEVISLIGMDPLEIYIRKERYDAVKKSLSELTSDHQDVIRLRMNGVSGAEIANMLGRSREAVYSLYDRALTQLEKNIRKNMNMRDE
jgi:RNA polymerase sigma-70 factor (ECF subfamily)